jgi:streptogramin lyase
MSKSGQNKKRLREISLKERPSGARPMKVVVDDKGNPWICDCQADPSKDLAEQGCWQFREEASTQSKERRLCDESKENSLEQSIELFHVRK